MVPLLTFSGFTIHLHNSIRLYYKTNSYHGQVSVIAEWSWMELWGGWWMVICLWILFIVLMQQFSEPWNWSTHWGDFNWVVLQYYIVKVDLHEISRRKTCKTKGQLTILYRYLPAFKEAAIELVATGLRFYLCTLQKQVGCFNHSVVTLVADKLERQWLWEVRSWYLKLIAQGNPIGSCPVHLTTTICWPPSEHLWRSHYKCTS